MAQVILFGGGDGGGIIIGPNGIKPIPPWTPRIQRQLRAVSALARLTADKGGLGREFEPLLAKLNDETLRQVATKAGRGEHSFVYFDDDGGGFFCGSTGKPPIPFPPRGTTKGGVG